MEAMIQSNNGSRYRIAWQNQVRDGMGKGPAMFTSRNDAEKMVAELNEEYPHIKHWVEEVV